MRTCLQSLAVASLSSALALAPAPAALAGVDLEARRLGFDRADATYGPTDPAELVLTYRPAGDRLTARDVRVGVEIGTSPATRIAYRIREVVFPQGDREFRMPLDLARLNAQDGTFAVIVTIDSDELVRETDETNNQARTRLTIARRGAPTGPTSTSAPSSAARVLEPRSQRVVAQTTCSMFEREWSSPAELGWHPGYGMASLVLEFDHPLAAVARTGNRIVAAALVLKGESVGRPFAELGAAQAIIRTKAEQGARCGSAVETRATLGNLDGRAEIDLLRAVRDAERLAPECAARLQVILSFPESPAEPRGGAFVRLDPQGAVVEYETGR